MPNPVPYERDYSFAAWLSVPINGTKLDNELMNIEAAIGGVVDYIVARARSLSLTSDSVDGSGRFDANGNRIEDLADPINGQDAVTRAFLIKIVEGLNLPSFDVADRKYYTGENIFYRAPFGKWDDASGLTLITYGGPNYPTSWGGHSDSPPRAGVMGLTTDAQIAQYGGAETVGLYHGAYAPPTISSQSGNYTATTFIPTTPLTADQRAKLKAGMVIKTAHSPNPCWGFITGWAANGTSVTVGAWYQLSGGVGVPVTPSNGVVAHLNAVTRVFNQNLNNILDANSHADHGIVAEWGCVNYKADYDFDAGTGATVDGFNIVSIGTKKNHLGLLVSRQYVLGAPSLSQFHRGILVTDTIFSGVEVSSDGAPGSGAPEYGFLYNIGGNSNAYTVGVGAGIKWNVNAQGQMYAAGIAGFGAQPAAGNGLVVQSPTAAGNVLLGQTSSGALAFAIREDGALVPRPRTVAELNALPNKTNGMSAFASNGRRAGQLAAAGTGCWAWWDTTAGVWIAADTGGLLEA